MATRLRKQLPRRYAMETVQVVSDGGEERAKGRQQERAK